MPARGALAFIVRALFTASVDRKATREHEHGDEPDDRALNGLPPHLAEEF